MSDESVLGVDLGTTNSVVAVADAERVRVLADAEGSLLTPSTVSFHPSGAVLVGHAAVERRLVDAQNTVSSIKRLIGRPFLSPEVARAAERFAFELAEGPQGRPVVHARGQTYSLPEISAFVLRRLARIAEAATGTRPERLVVTVPANFNDLQRTATRDAARIAGLGVERVLNEPTAAALAHGHSERSKKRIAVYDLGGGTFDISILDLSGDVIEVIATAGDTFLGGDDVDSAIAAKMADAFLRKHRIDLRQDAQGYERLRMAAEWLKCELSDQDVAQATLEQLGYDAGGRTIDFSFDLTRQALEGLAFPLLGRTFDICEEALKLAQLRPSQLDSVVLVGGQTRSPQVRRMVAEYFGRAPMGSLDPDRVVAQGAALQALALSGGNRAAVAVPKSVSSRPSGPPRHSTRPPGAPERPSGPPPLPRAPAAPAASAELASAKGGGLVRTLGGLGGPATRSVPPPAGQGSPMSGGTLPPPAVASRADAGAERGTVGISPEPLWIDVEDASGPLPAALFGEDDGSPSVPPALRSGPPAQGAAPDLASADFESDALTPTAVTDVQALVAEQASPGRKPRKRLKSTDSPSIVPSAMVPPLLLDVTPRGLAVETAGGYCEELVPRNAPIPTEQRRLFCTSQDNQVTVTMRVSQGEARRTDDNEVLGELELIDLPEGPRGATQIEVTFVLDADGMLRARAKDHDTGKAQEVRINLVGALSDDEVARLRDRQERLG